ncbi:hypothetical protein FVQ98_14625 [Ottowia sp. GY511]|uniref:XRE family transcriptional regulator n=1 Tax=Ottowia flava TaxID=2675430 RepID=A0ABW4KNH4_9BURK|nr:S24 family peptidase [Ottowia sp. GY511]TXK26389.1 hypothetical protein FVQ98_14625 [Ottowia sp. GY511]
MATMAASAAARTTAFKSVVLLTGISQEFLAMLVDLVWTRNPAQATLVIMSIHQTIKREREARGWSMEDLAAKVSAMEGLQKPLSWQAVQQWEKEDAGTAPKRKRLEVVAALFDMSVANLLGGYGGSPVAVLTAEEAVPKGYLNIKESIVRFTGGDGYIVPEYELIEKSTPATYRESWFREQRINPAQCKRFKVDGSSMENTLFQDDTVLVNMAETNIIEGRVYAIRYGEQLKIKRLYKRLDGGLILHSDNPLHHPQDEELSAEVVAEHIAVIGRVRDKSGPGGL